MYIRLIFQFETRDGTDSDENKLSETFKSFGFTVKILNNLKKHQMLKKLKDIPKEYGTDYDCIFVCILSHGCKGEYMILFMLSVSLHMYK